MAEAERAAGPLGGGRIALADDLRRQVRVEREPFAHVPRGVQPFPGVGLPRVVVGHDARVGREGGLALVADAHRGAREHERAVVADGAGLPEVGTRRRAAERAHLHAAGTIDDTFDGLHASASSVPAGNRSIARSRRRWLSSGRGNMVRAHRMHSRPAVATAFLVLLSSGIAPAQSPAPSAPPSPLGHPCADEPRSRALDFWIGDWDVRPAAAPQGRKPSRSHIERVEDGCVIAEFYTTPQGYSGRSINAYDAVKKRWQQVWMDNQ